MNDLTLFGITQEIEALDEMIANDSGEISESSEELEKYIETLLSNKISGIFDYLRTQEQLISMAKERAEEFKKFIEVKKNAVERFKEYVSICLQKSGKDKFDDGIYKISLSKPRKVLPKEIDVDDVPLDFVDTVYKIDRKGLLAYLKKNESQYIKLVDSKTSPKFSLKAGSEA